MRVGSLESEWEESAPEIEASALTECDVDVVGERGEVRIRDRVVDRAESLDFGDGSGEFVVSETGCEIFREFLIVRLAFLGVSLVGDFQHSRELLNRGELEELFLQGVAKME